ncbi:MAG: rhamnulokinase [Armatimonadota bacterium]|nr:MAG: rhamnulokinase [Armatimonadota bacterium]
MAQHALLAFDLGAESGRTILGTLDGRQLNIRELSRFPNGMAALLGHLHWDVLQLFQEMKKGLRMCAAEVTAEPESIGVDTWGVDFALLAPDGSLVGLPYGYRDPRTNGAMEEFFRRVPRERVYELTGIQFIQFNSLFQLFAMVRERCPLLPVASDMLFMPDLFNYLLTGARRNEFTVATTSQLYNPVTGDWEEELFAALGISRDIMQEIVPPGTVLGKLEGEICRETGLKEVPVIATASHDTAAAVAAAPAEGEGWAYISSGTWSLMGVETPKPIITDQSREHNFTNEGGVENTFRVLRNIMGLWLLRQCREAWAADRRYRYQELSEMALSAPPFKAVIEPDHPSFLNPPDMPEAIRNLCRKTKQPAPESPAEFVRCILESLALKYRLVLDQLREIHARPIETIHIIGGGARNNVLCQFTADATGVEVVAGPAEATAVGNLLVQALGLGCVGSLAEIRDIVRQSFSVVRYQPTKTPEWQSAYDRFRGLQS